jgi:RNA recognition motif-containing protein
LNEKGVGQCPNCRREYDQSNLNFSPQGEKEYRESILTYRTRKGPPSQDKKGKKKPTKNPPRRQLGNVRVIQRNLVYVVGLTLNVAKEDFMRRSDNFTKFGKIAKIVINKSNLTGTQKVDNVTRTPTVSAYITYTRPDDAQRAIQAVDGTWLDGKLLRASFGTTKYCSYFLKGIECTNPDCMYLHDYGQEEDTFNKEDIILKNGLPIPSNTERYEEYYPSKSNVEKQIWNFASSNQRQEEYEEEEYDEEYEEEEHVVIPEPISPRKEKNVQIVKTEPKKDFVLPSTAQWGQGVPIKPIQVSTKPIPVVTPQMGAWGKGMSVQQQQQQQQNGVKNEVFDSHDQVYNASPRDQEVQFSFNSLQIGKSQWGTETVEKRNKSRFQFAQDERKSEFFDPFMSDNFEFGFGNQSLQDSFRALLPNVKIQFNNTHNTEETYKDFVDTAILDYQ